MLYKMGYFMEMYRNSVGFVLRRMETVRKRGASDEIFNFRKYGHREYEINESGQSFVEVDEYAAGADGDCSHV